MFEYLTSFHLDTQDYTTHKDINYIVHLSMETSKFSTFSVYNKKHNSYLIKLFKYTIALIGC